MSKKRNFDKQEGLEITKSVPKRIGFFSAVIMTIGCCIGSGIFFKSGTVMQYSNNSILLSLGCWIIAAMGVIAMAIALIDIASQSKKDNRGFLSWIKKFNKFFVYKMAKNYFAFFYIPINWFVLPVYIFQSLQSGLCYIGATWANNQVQFSEFGQNVLNFPWWGVLIVSTLLASWFIIMSGLSVKFGNLTSLVVNSIKFIPLGFALIIGFVIFGLNGSTPKGNVLPYEPIVETTTGPMSFFALSPVFGVFMSMSAIFFAYDGFYVAAGLGDKLKEPKKIPWILLTGLLIVTAVYLIIALGITLGAKGGQWENIGEFFVAKNLSWIYVIINTIIAIGIIGGLNGYAMWGALLYEDLLADYEAPFSKKLQKYLHKKRSYVGTFYQFIIGVPILVLFIVIGAFAYNQAGKATIYSTEMGNVYALCDLLSNWQTVIAFMFIAIAILSYSIKKIISHSKKTARDWFFISCGLFSSIIVMIGLLAQFVAPFVNLGLQVSWNDSHPDKQVSIISNICLIVLLFVIILLCVIPSIIEMKNKKLILMHNLQNKIDDLQLKLAELEQQKQQMITYK